MLIRTIHRYAGAFFAPAILFFCLSGFLQTFDLHKIRPTQHPAEIILRLASLHKDQTLELPKPKPAKRPGDEGGKPARAPEAPKPERLGQTLMKGFVALTSVALAGTTLLGLYMALRARRGRAVVWAMVALGVVVPVGLLLL